MRIAICWAHWVWKSTIARELSSSLWLEILPDIVVDAYKMWLEINEWTPIETQTWLVWNQMANEKLTSSFIADKCIFDYYIYAKALWMDNDIVNVANKVAQKTNNYDFIFYIEPEFPIVDDWIISTNIDFQSTINNEYLNFLNENWIKFIKLSGSVSERLNQALVAISKK